MIFLKCPICKAQNRAKSKKCKCGLNIDALKKTCSAVYYIEYRLPDGKKKREKVGNSYNEAVAAEGLRKVQKAENKILDINKDANVTFNALSEWFFFTPHFQKLKYKNVLKINIETFCKTFGNYTIKSITRLDLENYQIKRIDEGKKPSYIDQEIGAARNMLNIAWCDDRISGDPLRPFQKIKKLLRKNENARDITISYEDFLDLLSVMKKHARDIMATAFFTGMRNGEIVALTWDRVDLEKRVITLESKHTKTNSKRMVPICADLHAIFKNIPRHIIVDEDGIRSFSPFVFLYKGYPVKSIRASLENACKNVGIPYGRNKKDGITFHDFRHTFTTYMRQSGVHDSVIMAITGHKTYDMFHRYNSVKPHEQVEGVNDMERFIKKSKVKGEKNERATGANYGKNPY